MNLWKGIIILIILVVLGAGAYNLIKANFQLNKKVEELSRELKKVEEENNYLTAQIKYLEKPENLLKEVKSQFNYRQAGEELIIIVPNCNSTTTRP